MQAQDHFPRNSPFRPSPALIPWFIIDAVLFIALMLACTILPMWLSGPIDLPVILAILAVLGVVFISFVAWTRFYFDTMSYELHDDELRWKRGVWFRTTGIVPYNRITNLDLRQGPVMRWLGISTISVQTAGYSGQAVPEIRIEAIEHAEELRELLRSSVRACSAAAGDGTGTSARAPQPVADMPFATTGTSMLILDELKKIRTLLEQQRK